MVSGIIQTGTYLFSCLLTNVSLYIQWTLKTGDNYTGKEWYASWNQTIHCSQHHVSERLHRLSSLFYEKNRSMQWCSNHIKQMRIPSSSNLGYCICIYFHTKISEQCPILFSRTRIQLPVVERNKSRMKASNEFSRITRIFHILKA